MLVLLLLSLAVGIITFILAWGPFGVAAAIGSAIGAGALAICLAGLWFAYGPRHSNKAGEAISLAEPEAEIIKNRHEHLEPRTPPAV